MDPKVVDNSPHSNLQSQVLLGDGNRIIIPHGNFKCVVELQFVFLGFHCRLAYYVRMVHSSVSCILHRIQSLLKTWQQGKLMHSVCNLGIFHPG